MDGTVSVLNVGPSYAGYYAPAATIPVGTEPYGIALTPTGRKLYVANARSNSVSVIDTASLRVTTTIANVGPEPRGIAITNAGSGDDTAGPSSSRSSSRCQSRAKSDGADDAKAGHVERDFGRDGCGGG